MRAKLERVLGCTLLSRASVSVDENKGIVAYPAGSTVVLHNPNNNSQAHIIASTANTITCLCFSKCGKYLAVGEKGHEPSVRVWELHYQNSQFTSVLLVDSKQHDFAIACIQFTPDGMHLISIGDQHDKAIIVWDWRNKQKLASNRLLSKVYAADVAENGLSCVTVGVRHVKFWHLSEVIGSKCAPLQGRSAILAEQRNNTFLDVCCAPNNRTFSITDTSLLVEFHDKKLVSTYDLREEVPLSIALGHSELFIGFSHGTIRSFDLETMVHNLTYCKPHYLNCDIAECTNSEAFRVSLHPKDCRYPNVRALCYNRKANVLTAVYADRSIYNWRENRAGNQIYKVCSQLFHVGPISALEIYPPYFSWLPAGTFITGGADETVRIWNIDRRVKVFEENSYLIIPQSNVYSEELKKVIYLSKNEALLTESYDKITTAQLSDVTNGVKALRVSPDGRHLAVGGRDGNLSVLDLTEKEINLIAFYEAHDSEIMCLEFSSLETARCLLASGSRDRVVHLFDPTHDYEPVGSVEDHTSAINSIVFSVDVADLELITCAADKTIVIRKLIDSQRSRVSFERMGCITSQFGLNSMIKSSEGITVACQDRQIRTYALGTKAGKLIRNIKGSSNVDGQLTKIRLDPSETFAATVCTDRNVYIIDISTGECSAVLTGYSCSITDVAFSSDCRRLIVVSHSGCVFIWRLSTVLTNRMLGKLKTAHPNQYGYICEKVKERSVTPDSLLGSGSEAACEESHKMLSLLKMRDSESEFGSLNSVRIADEDRDSCIGQTSATVVLNQHIASSVHEREFELKRIAAEVIRRNTALQGVENTDSNQNSEGFETSEEFDSLTVDEVAGRPQMSQLYTTSRSMSNLRPSISEHSSVAGLNTSRKPRKKWDDGSGYASPITFHQQFNQKEFVDANQDRNQSNPVHQLNSPSHYCRRNATSTPKSGVNNSLSMSSISHYQEEVTPSRTGIKNGEPDFRFVAESLPICNDAGQIMDASVDGFNRSSIERCSLTKKFMSTCEKPKTVWTPPASDSRRTSSNMHYSSPSLISSLFRRQSDKFGDEARSRFYQPNRQWICADTDVSSSDGGSFRKRSRRFNQISRLKQSQHRQMTIGGIDQQPTNSSYDPSSMSTSSFANNIAPVNVHSNRQDEDYASSDLHLRSRSQSPSQLKLHLADNARQRQREDSDMSACSSITMTSSRMTPSNSRSNLRIHGCAKKQYLEAVERSNLMRDMLRKSQENLAAVAGESYYQIPSCNSGMLRSKSIGNLRLSSVPFYLSANRLNNANDAISIPDSPNLSGHNDSLDGSLLSGNRSLTRSVGSLYSNTDFEPSSSEMRERQWLPNRFGKTIESLKKASNPDLTKVGASDPTASSSKVGGSRTVSISGESGTYAAAHTRRSKGSVQKRMERFNPLISRESTSGESDSNLSDLNQLCFTKNCALQTGTKQSFIHMSTPHRSTSCVEEIPRQGMIQDTSSYSDEKRCNSSFNVSRRIPNYFVQKFADKAGPTSAINYDDRKSFADELNALNNWDGRSQQSKQMARHVAECLDQFNTGLDKVLQARQLLESSQHLLPNDRNAMIRVLNQALQNGRKRLNTSSEFPLDEARNPMCSTGQHKSSSMRDTPNHSNDQQTAEIDPAAFLQQHGPQLLAILQQNMAKQN